MAIGSLRTNKGWAELLREVREEFRKWGIGQVVYPTKKDGMIAGEVALLVQAKNGEWMDIKCGAFAGTDGPERNMCAVREAVRGFRLADQRGIGSVFMDVSRLLALPSPEAATDPYSVLGVSRSTGRDELLRAYRERVKRAHPDHGGSQDEFIRVQEAGKALGVA